VRLSGPLHRVLPRGERAAVLEFARSNPIPDLFDVGDGASLHLVEVSKVSLVRSGAAEAVDAAEYAEAEPDPLHECEGDLLADIADHHGDALEAYVRHLSDRPDHGAVRAVRLDRYGLVVDLAADRRKRRLARLEFSRGVRNQHDLAHVLHPILFHHHRCCKHDD
jgi:hypothetical protein